VKAIGYTYDAHNQRIGKSIDGVVAERHAVDRDQIALVFDGQGNQTHRYLYGTGVDQVLADETSNGVTWALADHQGTVKDLLDGNGTIISHIAYDSFGRVISNTGNIDFRYGYTGRDYDSETGLEYYRARYYDAAIGEFISEDPLGFDAGDGNLMRYVFNSSTNYTDPSGEFAFLSLVPMIVTGVLTIAAGEALFPDNVQAPMHSCDYHPTPPDQQLKRAAVEIVTDLGVSIGTQAIKLGLKNLSRNSGDLVHMSPYADEIIASGKLGLPSNNYAGPASNSQLNGLSLTMRTGLTPGLPYKPIPIPQSGLSAFSKVTPIGPMTTFQRITGQQYTAKGILDLETGVFTKTGTNFNQLKIYAIDATVTSTVIVVGADRLNSR
jgi:RHS repeat-associated protein